MEMLAFQQNHGDNPKVSKATVNLLAELYDTRSERRRDLLARQARSAVSTVITSPTPWRVLRPQPFRPLVRYSHWCPPAGYESGHGQQPDAPFREGGDGGGAVVHTTAVERESVTGAVQTSRADAVLPTLTAGADRNTGPRGRPGLLRPG